MEIASFPSSSLYHPDWETLTKNRCSDPTVLSVIITRNPIERIWSAYWWSQKWKTTDMIHPTFEEFLHWEPPDRDWRYVSSGLVDPIDCCDYEKYMKKAYKYNPIILRFEDMIKNPNFPNLAKTNDVLKKCGDVNHRGIKMMPKIDDYHRKLIKEELNKAGIPDHN